MISRSTFYRRLAAAAVATVALAGLFLLPIIGQTDSPPQGDEVSAARLLPEPPNPTGECMQEVRSIYGRVSTPPGADSTCAFSCRVIAHAADTATMKTSVADVDYILNERGMWITSDYFSAYRDSFDVFTVIPGTRTIFRSDGRGSFRSEMSGADMGWIRDSILTRSQLLECADESDSTGAAIRRVRLAPDPAVRGRFGIQEMTLLLDLERRQLRMVRMIPTDASLYAKIEWYFSPLKIGLATEEFRRPVAERFIAADGEVRGEWKGYKMVDNRMLAHIDRSE